MAERDEEMIRGTVQSIVFQNAENGYTVLRLRTEGGDQITVTGTIPMTLVGERLVIAGKWGRHPSHGPQFEAEFLERLMPETTQEIFSYLSSRAVKGIGAKTAAKIVERFGAQSLDVLENEPSRLAEIPGITRSKAAEMSSSFRRQSGVRRLIEFLTIHRLPPELAVRLYRIYGPDAQDALRDDPYLLVDPYYGADFAAVDAFALELELPADDERRVEAGVLFELSFNLNHGHTFIPVEKLCAATAALLSLEPEIIRAGMTRLSEQERMVVDRVAGLEACYLPQFYEAEEYVCRRILEMTGELEAPSNLDSLVDRAEQSQSLTYAAQQREAIRMAAQRQLLIVTGGPGTGKTTVMSGILALYDQMKVKTLLAAPTGRAAKRLAECTGREASTIHRLLESQFDEETGMMSFFHDEDEPLPCDALIVDETSMVDLQLMTALLRALKPKCRLILVGDPDQLPSVGAGNLFADLIRSGRVETVRLTEIFRQASQSLIVMNAHAVNAGEMPRPSGADGDFFIMKRADPASVIETVAQLCAQRLPKHYGFTPAQIQVLSPAKRHGSGTIPLNRRLQEALNPPSESKLEKRFGDTIFREGDRVMQVRNNYDIVWEKQGDDEQGTGVFNGDVGEIIRIFPQQECMVIRFDDRIATYTFDMLNELELAYAVTVHKSQGSEFDAVVLALSDGLPRKLLTRNILYTAITRAKRLLVIVGSQDVVAYMVNNNQKGRRYSALKARLRLAETQ